MVRILSPIPKARPARAAALALGCLALGVRGAAAQQGPLTPGTPDPAYNFLTAIDPEHGLRGTVPFADPAPTLPVLPTAPVQPAGPDIAGPTEDGAPLPGRRPIAGQGGALLTPRVGPPRLPALAAYPSSQRPKGAAIDTLDRTISPTITPVPTDPALSPAVAALAVPAPLARRPVDPAPFAPLGYTFGVLRLFPYVQQSLGYDTNPEQVSGGRASAFSRTEAGFSLLSLWSSNLLTAEMRGGYDAFFQNHDADRPDALGRVDYRHEVTRDIALDAEARFAVATQRQGSPELTADTAALITDRPVVASYGVSLGGTDTLGRLTVGLRGLIDRTTYEDARLGNGGRVPLSTQDFTSYGVSLRADYELLPTLRPFAEVVVDTRIHDDRIDYTGFDRDSDGVTGRIGTSFELSPLLLGSVSGGYGHRSYADRRLTDLNGPVVDASIVYAVTPLTAITLLANTSFNETNVLGSPGSQSRGVSLSVSHALLRNLTLTAAGSYLNTDYIASPIVENTYAATLKADYNITRWLLAEVSYTHQTLHSTLPGSSFTQDVVLGGLRWQP